MNPRTCIGCRRKADASELIRIVLDGESPGVVRVDPRRRMPGRGAHLHPSPDCLEAALRRRAFARALRSATPVEVAELESYVAALGSHDRHP